jgi:CHAT domain-containing protein
MAPDIDVAVVNEAGCERFGGGKESTEADPKGAKVLNESATGSLTQDLDADTYCLVVTNRSPTKRDIQLVLSSEPSTAASAAPSTYDQMVATERELLLQAKYPEAEAMLSGLLKTEQARPQDVGAPIAILIMLAPVYLAEGKWSEAEDADREMMAEARGPGIPDEFVSIARQDLASVLLTEGHAAEARELITSAYPNGQPVLGVKTVGMIDLGANDLLVLISADHLDGRLKEAEAGIRRLLAPDAKTPLVISAMLHVALAKIVDEQGRLAEADAAYRDAFDQLASIGEVGTTFEGPAHAIYASLLERENRPADGELAARQAIAFSYKSKFFPKTDSKTTALMESSAAPGLDELGRLLRLEGDQAEAVAVSRQACRLLAHGEAAPAPGASALTEAFSTTQTACDRDVALSLWGLAADGPGRRTPLASGASGVNGGTFAAADLTDTALRLDPPAAGPFDNKSLGGEAFADAQRADLSSAGEALSRAAALVAAKAAGAGDLAGDYERALVERSNLESAVGAAGGQGQGAIDPNAASARIEEIDKKIAGLAADLQTRYPLYWDYRSPSPLAVDRLQAASGADAALLGAGEAVVLWMVAPGADKGLVFALSKRGFAWARMGMSGAEIAGLVRSLRAKLDPLGAVGGSVSGQDLAAAGQSSAGGMTQGGATQGPAPAPASTGFDRAGAYRLYQALLGDEAIQKVIHGPGIDTLLIVPSGALTSLPPAVLVTSPPQGRDDDPAALSATHWLINADAIAVLPQVSALKTLRQLLPAAKGSASGPSQPLLAFADPDFAGAGQVPGVFPGRDPYVLDSGQTQSHADRGAPPAAAAERDGRSRAAVLAELPPLWDTRREGLELMGLLHADHADLLLGPAATKTALFQRQADHSLARVKVLDFSTHGLITGDFAGLTEPALALAAPPKGTDPKADDQLLRASEAAGLTLTADWVVLSACNTAAGDTPGAEGLSGLARAFFHAGAKSLLVSHWRVDDNATERLIATTFATYQAGGLTKAKALQHAMTEMIKDPAAANPSLWGPFVIVGEPR